MFKLMKLELTKNRFRGPFLAFLIITAAWIGFITLMGAVADEGEKMFIFATDMLDMGAVLMRISFGIFAGTLIADLIISEYKSGTVKMLFTYPVPRKKIMASKLLLIFSSTFLAVVFSNLLYGVGIGFLNDHIRMVEEDITVRLIFGRAPSMVFDAFMVSGISLISLFFGMLKKSTTHTVVASVVISAVMNGSVAGNSAQTSLFSFAVVPMIMCLAGVVIALWSCHNIDRLDL